ncbi:DgyrCDS6951 [Dimorphilus gyrociliatus]|uniref:Poly [ADP-ribose] polymerase n=1 Tax=Dimorphilus gyrociliatus TaxID=2664684 RepID=A0A7I8VRU5_9ANNE|nr:DgyrCDS6951 [Dimorphilus gyrociliatus]
MVRDVSAYLFEQQRKSSSEVSQEWAALEDLYNRKLWHQLTIRLQKFVKNAQLQQGDAIMQLYQNFISDFEHRMNPLALVEILIPVARQMKDNTQALAFIEKIRKEKVKNDNEAVVLCLITEGNYYILLNDTDKVKHVIDEAGNLLEELDGVTSVHAPYYELCSNFHKRQANHADYYRDALRYLGCIDVKTLSNQDQIERAFNIGLAAILGSGIYNFGELLQHDILEALRKSDKSWLVQLLFAFNSGNISQYQDLKVHWSKQPDLNVNEKYMRQKISLLCLMEMTFKRPATERVLNFSDIAKETDLNKGEVEHLVMRALSLKLVKGSIDQVDQTVHMSWVQPRVLDKDQIRTMADRLNSWCDQVSSMEASRKSTPAKKEKVNASWEWLDEDGNWYKFTDHINQQLNQSFRAGSPSATVQEYIITFRDMIARKEERQYYLRYFLNNVTWKVENHHPMNAENVELIEAAFKAKQPSIQLTGVYVENDEDDDLVEITFDDMYAMGGIIDNDIKRIESGSKAVPNQSDKIPVDSHITCPELYKVYVEGDDIYDAMLNQTNIGKNNNKFYVIQLLIQKSAASYCLWTRWGRVGVKGQSSLISYQSTDEAKKAFEKKNDIVVPGGKSILRLESAPDSADVAKKPKLECSWQWLDLNNKWNKLPDEVNADINAAYEHGKKTVKVSGFNINFKNMIAKKARKEIQLRYLIGMTIDILNNSMKFTNKSFPLDNEIWQIENVKTLSAYNVTRISEALKTKESTVDITDLHLENGELEELATVDFDCMTAVGESVEDKLKKITSDVTVTKTFDEDGLDVKTETKETDEKPITKSTKTYRMEVGKIPVDPEISNPEIYEVYVEGDDIYDAMLNQTNVNHNNNKFYIIQLLKQKSASSYCVWTRWGRVGVKGQTNLARSSLDGAKKTFEKKFYDKTRNQWSSRKSFVKIQGKYDLVHIDYSTDTAKPEVANPKPGIKTEIRESSLDKPVQDLIKLISDVKAMEAAVVELKYDAEKAPLGKLTPNQIKAGFAALKSVVECIEGKSKTSLVDACSNFYTKIPHNFGMKRPPLISTMQEVKTKLQLLETLGDIEIAMNVLKNVDEGENPIDSHYKSLRCDLKLIKQESNEFKIINEYMQNTHAKTHRQYDLEIKEIFEVERDGEDKVYNDVGNKMLLWHGSRLTNWVGILSKGLRIAPPEAPVTGYMFGKGVYFADMSSKSANYCFANKVNSTGLLLLCEVALGETCKKFAADYNASNLPKGMSSTHGVGRTAPDPKVVKKLNDVIVPCGKGVDNPLIGSTKTSLMYNEYIVYDVQQIRMKYLIRTNFKFK